MQLHQVGARDLERFLDAPGQLLKESGEVQTAIASFSETSHSLLKVLLESDYSTVVEVIRKV